MAYGVVCEKCGIEAPSKRIRFYQNIGAIILRFHKRVDAYLCKNCIRETFWNMTMITLGIGWLGILSIIIAPIYVISNIVEYLTSLRLPAVPEGAKRPQLSNELVALLNPYHQTIAALLRADEDVQDLARDVAQKANVSPGEVFAYIIAMQRSQRVAPAPVAAGFPVIMPPPISAGPPPPPIENG